MTRQNSLKKRIKFTHLPYKGRSFWLGIEGSSIWQENLRIVSIIEETSADRVCDWLRTLQKENNWMPEILLGL